MKEIDTLTTAELPEDRFERIGTTYYKLVRQPNAAGQLVERSIPWTIEAIRQDYGKDFLANIPKYDGFCCVPAHIDYQPVIGNSKNKYSPLTHLPEEGVWPHIEALVHHIFGDQYELGLDYLQILYTMPLQKLPILLLVSEEILLQCTILLIKLTSYNKKQCNRHNHLLRRRNKVSQVAVA